MVRSREQLGRFVLRAAVVGGVEVLLSGLRLRRYLRLHRRPRRHLCLRY